jgi:hypothetical protein
VDYLDEEGDDVAWFESIERVLSATTSWLKSPIEARIEQGMKVCEPVKCFTRGDKTFAEIWFGLDADSAHFGGPKWYVLELDPWWFRDAGAVPPLKAFG